MGEGFFDQWNDHTTRVIEPTDDGVLFGRGTHPGNIRFREKVLELKAGYEASNAKEKYHVSQKVIESFRLRDNVSFETGDDGLWYEMNGNQSRKKASHALDNCEKSNDVTTPIMLSLSTNGFTATIKLR